MSGPQDPAAAGCGQLWAGRSDREQVIEALKGAFVDGRRTRRGSELPGAHPNTAQPPPHP